jgi:hypothetical protein
VSTYPYDVALYDAAYYDQSPHEVMMSWDTDVYAVVEVSYEDPGDAPVWVDETAYLDQLSISRGRSTELSQTAAGRALVVFNNQDGHFDPTNVSGLHYPDVVPIRRVRCYAAVDTGRESFRLRSSRLRDGGVYRAQTYRIPLFNGLIEGWSQTWPDEGARSVVAADSVDGLSVVAAAQYTDTSVPAELSGTRVTRVLDDIDWPSADRSVAAGIVQIVTANVDANALTHIQDVVDSEGGVMFIDTLGRFVFLDADHATSVSGADTWGDAYTESGYESVAVSYDIAQVWNDVRVETAGDTTSTVTDAASILRFFRRTRTLASLINLDADRTARANALLAAYKDPKIRVTEVRPSANSLDEWVRVFRTELADGRRVRRRQPGGGLIEQDSRIEGIDIDFIATGEQKVLWKLSGVADAYISRTFYLGSTTSDLSGGADFNRYLEPDPDGNATITFSIVTGSTEVSRGFTRAGGVPAGATPTSTYYVGLDLRSMTGVSDSDELSVGVQVHRTNNAGTVQTSSAVAQGPRGLHMTDFPATYEIPIPGTALGTFAADDRLRVDYRFEHSRSVTGTPVITIGTGTTSSEVIAPVS